MYTKNFLRYIFNRIKPSNVNLKVKLLHEMKSFFHVDCMNGTGCYSSQKKVWKKYFIGIADLPFKNSIKDIWNGFANERIILKKSAATCKDFSAPVVICAIKDDILYLKQFLPYYRRLGVRHFVFIDNGSADGSIEFLEKQNDVSLFLAPYKFTGRKKAGWKLQALAYFGLNHWYVWLDIDEFLVYPGMEQTGLQEYTEILSAKGIKRVGAFMLDMYPSYELMSNVGCAEHFLDEYVYFDPYSDNYRIKNNYLFGGMRGRALDIYDLRLDKYPLIYCTEDKIPFGNHDVFPLHRDFEKSCGCVLKHYKFLPNDANKYIWRATDKDSGFASFSAQKKYATAIGKKVIYDGSEKYTDSSQLKEFPFVHDLINENNIPINE